MGGLSLVCVVVAWFLVPTQHKFDDGNGNKISWNDALDQLHANGVDATFSRGPQLGYFLTIAAAVIALVAGALMLVMRDRTPAAPATFTPPGWSVPQPTPGYAPAPFGYGSPPTAPAPPNGGWSAPTSYTNDQADGDRPDGRPDLTK